MENAATVMEMITPHGPYTDEGDDGGTNEEDLVEEQAHEFSHFSELEIADDAATL
jgi:hypothetical protein